MKSNISSVPKFDCEATESIGVAKAGYWLGGEVDVGGDDEDDASDAGGMVFSVDGVLRDAVPRRRCELSLFFLRTVHHQSPSGAS